MSLLLTPLKYRTNALLIHNITIPTLQVRLKYRSLRKIRTEINLKWIYKIVITITNNLKKHNTTLIEIIVRLNDSTQ